MKWLCDLLNCKCECPECPECPEPAVCRGTPRLQFKRRFDLINSAVKEDVAARIFQRAFASGRTVGLSADDAGLGDLDIKIVNAYGWSNFGALVAFFDEHYPGTTVNDMPLPILGYRLVTDVSAAGQGVVSRESFKIMRDAGVSGVYIRGPRGTNSPDTALQHNYLNASDEGLDVGMFGIWFPNQNPYDQAQMFINSYSSYIWDLPPAGDFELDGDPNAGESAEIYLGVIREALGIAPMVYTRATWWDANVGNRVWASQYPLWVAGYPNPQLTWHYPEEYGTGYTPLGWSDWDMWQFGQVRGEYFKVQSDELDMNWMKV